MRGGRSEHKSDHLACNTEETFLQDCLVILKRLLQNYLTILKKCFRSITGILSPGSDSQAHNCCDIRRERVQQVVVAMSMYI